MIFHICTEVAWQDALKAGTYLGDMLQSHGFIRCSTVDQTVKVANHIFLDTHGLMLLVIDETAVTERVAYEDAGNGKLHPHIYGPLQLASVIIAIPFPPQADGTFVLPASLG